MSHMCVLCQRDVADQVMWPTSVQHGQQAEVWGVVCIGVVELATDRQRLILTRGLHRYRANLYPVSRVPLTNHAHFFTWNFLPALA